MQFSDHVMYAVLAIVLVAIGVTWIKDYAEEHGKSVKELVNNFLLCVLGTPAVVFAFMNLPKYAVVLLPLLYTANALEKRDTNYPKLAYAATIFLYLFIAIDYFLGIRALMQFRDIQVLANWHYNEFYKLGWAPLIGVLFCAVVIVLTYFVGGRRPYNPATSESKDVPVLRICIVACVLVLFFAEDENEIKRFYNYVPRTKSEHVSSYYRSDGTHVRSYYRRPRW